jgi:hypothetical protein
VSDARQQINEYLQAEGQAFCVEFIRDRAAALRQRKTDASGELSRSLEYQVRAQAMNAGVEVLIAFEEHGRYIDMRRLQPGSAGADYLTRLIKWIEEKGLKEKMIQGYMRRRKLKKVPERVMTYLAFGIVKKRFNGKYRRTRWYNKAKSRQITELFDDILAGLPAVVMEELKAELLSGSAG